MSLLRLTQQGLYCEEGDFYIDPVKPVKKALITHAHADHARYGHQHYLSTPETAQIMKVRLGEKGNYQSIAYNQALKIKGVKVSFHPAGHVLGSAQIKIDNGKERWVVTGDYKLENDGISAPFEQVKCDTLITESTFGLPVFNWLPQENVMQQINDWWQLNAAQGINSIILAYAFGKAQRILANLPQLHGPIYCHGAVEKLNQIHETLGISLPKRKVPDARKKKVPEKGALIIAPPSALNTTWIERFRPYETGFASGWMAIRGTRRRRGVAQGFVLSDHVDWKGLNLAVESSEAEKIILTHGYTSQAAKWFAEKGYKVEELKLAYAAEDEI